jgi:anti-sigma regulatory factor (Ser/Thr protein kinase)
MEAVVLTLPVLHQSARVVLSDESCVGEARRLAAAWAHASGFDAAIAGKLALLVTEASSNAVFHAGGGEIVLRRMQEHGQIGIEMLALDRGPGMRNVAQCMQDGFSTRGTSGAGLGSIQRSAHVFDIYSAPERGTAIMAQVWSGQAAPPPLAATCGAVCIPIASEEVCGDGFALVFDPKRALIMIADGLGHGQGAADATLVAVRVFQANSTLGPVALMQQLHAALRPTRGAAIALAELDFEAAQLRFLGIGNCSGSIHGTPGARTQGLASHNGTVGAQIPRLYEFTHAWPPGGLLLLHSDGLATRWHLDDYAGLSRRHPSLIAGVLYRDFARSRDDVTVLAFGTRSA